VRGSANKTLFDQTKETVGKTSMFASTRKRDVRGSVNKAPFDQTKETAGKTSIFAGTRR
jgi:hypothetical protein